MHTVVVYTTSETVSFCSLSECLKHDAGAIWAHLNPIIEQFILANPELQVLHFLSDSPSTQYRNEQMFSFMAHHVGTLYPNIQYITWNYHEAGHGKGAPDGIGGVCKRTADRVVSHGEDIPNFTKLIKVLTENCPGVKILTITGEEIDKMTELLATKTVLSFSGTMKVHQIKTIEGSGVHHMKTLSCFKCQGTCPHYGLGTLIYEKQVRYSLSDLSSNDSDSSDSDVPLSSLIVGRKKSTLFYPSVYGDEAIAQEPHCTDTQLPSSSSNKKKHILAGTYILVQFENKCNKKLQVELQVYRYVAVCQNDIDASDREVKVTFLKVCEHSENKEDDTQLFKVDVGDTAYISENQIIKILSSPEIVLKGDRFFFKFQETVDVFEKA